MRRIALTLALVASAALAPIVPACSSTEAAPADAGGDTAIGPNQFTNAPCDPTLPNACLPAPCSAVDCNPVTMTCIATPLPGACQGNDDAAFVIDSGQDSGPVVVSAGCATDQDCPSIPSPFEGGTPIVLVCGFSAFDGCNATGTCRTAEPPHTTDGAVDIACGCDGQPVLYVTETQTAAPVQSATPCVPTVVVDSGVDAGPDAADAGTDAADDAQLDAPADG